MPSKASSCARSNEISSTRVVSNTSKCIYLLHHFAKEAPNELIMECRQDEKYCVTISISLLRLPERKFNFASGPLLRLRAAVPL